MKTIFVVLILIAISACGPVGRDDNTHGADVRFGTGGGYSSSIFEFKLKNGTDCVLVGSDHGGTAISCDWGRSQ